MHREVSNGIPYLDELIQGNEEASKNHSSLDRFPPEMHAGEREALLAKKKGEGCRMLVFE
jgi:hypothetical protein